MWTDLGTTGVYAAEAEDGIPAGTMVVVINDPLQPFGLEKDYIWVPTGQNPFRGQAVYTGAPAGIYEIHILTRFESPSSAELWLKVDSQPFLGPPSNADADILNNRSPVLSPTWIQVGRTGSAANYVAGIKSEPQRALTITSGQSVYLMAQAGLQIDCIVLRPVGNTEAINCPSGNSGVGTQSIADYTLKEIGANSPTIDGTLESFVAQANSVNYLGRLEGNEGTNTVTRLAWEDSTNRIYFWHTTTLAGLTSQGTAEDSSLIIDTTRFEFVFRLVDLQRVRDASTYKFLCNLGGFIYDRNDAGGVSNPAFDFSDRACAVTYTNNVLVIEGYVQPAENLVPGQLLLFDGAAGEEVSGTAATGWVWRCQTGTNLLPDCWGIAQLSATTMRTPPDTRAPVVSPPVCTPHQTGATCVAAITEADSFPVTCRAFRDGDDDNEVTTDGAFRTTSCGTMVGGNCTCSFSGLTLPDHEMQVEATDAVGNIGVSAIADFSLMSPSGPTFYIGATGNNALSCTSVGSRCANVAGVMAKDAFIPGSTIIIGDGTYTHPNLININCAVAPSKFNGTPSARITLKAENERKAHFQQTDGKHRAFVMTNCQYWTIEGLHLEGGDFATGLQNQPTITFGVSHNLIIRRNIFRHANRFYNSSMASLAEAASGNLIESNEFYAYHRNGFTMGTNGVLRLNYANGRCHTNIAGVLVVRHPAPAGTCGNQTHTADSGFVFYTSAMMDNIIESNIAEKASAGFDIQTADTKLRLRFVGNIARDNGYGFLHKAREAGSNRSPVDSVFIDNLALLGGDGQGFNHRGIKNTISRNNTAYGTTGGCFAADAATRDPGAGPPYTISFTNDLAVFCGSTGFFVDLHDIPTGNFTIANSTSHGNAGSGNFNPSSNAGYSGINTSAPNLGHARACVPRRARLLPVLVLVARIVARTCCGSIVMGSRRVRSDG